MSLGDQIIWIVGGPVTLGQLGCGVMAQYWQDIDCKMDTVQSEEQDAWKIELQIDDIKMYSTKAELAIEPRRQFNLYSIQFIRLAKDTYKVSQRVLKEDCSYNLDLNCYNDNLKKIILLVDILCIPRPIFSKIELGAQKIQ